jgi:hypothetical protein
MKRINLLQLLFLTSCVSVQLQKPLVLEKSKFYSLVTPGSPFISSAQPQMDHYWRNPKTGNAISLQTACSEKYDPSLQDLTYQSIQGIEDIEKVKEARTQYNERAALGAEYKGHVDGIAVSIQLIAFKKNNCSYVISYFGKKSEIQVDQNKFDNFMKNFKVK